jgi:para-nitrobenzyl esterase
VAARYGDKRTATDEATAEAANAYWSAFAKAGDPNGQGRQHWPAYDAAHDVLMDFTNQGPVAEPDPWSARLDLTQAAVQ